MTQYGPQGHPLSIADAQSAAQSTEPTAAPASTSPPAPPASPAPAPAPSEEVLAVDVSMRLDEAERAMASVRAMVTAWENRAESVLIKSDYQRGQRDATFSCIGDLRNVLGI